MHAQPLAQEIYSPTDELFATHISKKLEEKVARREEKNTLGAAIRLHVVIHPGVPSNLCKGWGKNNSLAKAVPLPAPLSFLHGTW